MHIVTFDWDGRTAERYRQNIREYLGYRVANIQDIELAINYLADNVIPRCHPDSVII